MRSMVMGATAIESIKADGLPSSVEMPKSAILCLMDADAESVELRLVVLLQAVARKDRAAFDAFYSATTERVLSMVLRITRKIEIAEEVAGDVYLQVWRQADRFDPARGHALAWLMMICRSRALDAIRRNSVMPTHSAVPISEIPEPETMEFPQDLLDATEQHGTLHEALLQLKPEQRQLLALAYFRGFSHSELAGFTGLPLGTIKTQLRRTVAKLKEIMTASDNREQASA